MIHYFKQLYNSFASEDLLLIFISIVIGLIIGWEREYRNKTAGLRTVMLVCVGSCVFTILSLKIGVNNPDRLAANIITGIGFLGAGAIFKDENKINGITTACTIWVTAALGMCIGSGHIYLGLLTTVVVIFVLWSLVTLEKWIDHTHKIHEYKITTIYQEQTINSFEKIFDDHLLIHSKVFQMKSDGKLTVVWRLAGKHKQHHKLTTQLLNDTSILRLEI
jgi:putative Mg2+ transporter-C (MgtC) family protein